MSFPFLLIFALYAIRGPVEITVRPSFAMAPNGFQATIIIDRDEHNRLLEIEYDGPEYKYSQYQLDGDKSKRAFQPRPWYLRSVGEYIATATVTRIVEGQTKKLVATAQFRVLGGEPPPEF